tara:strand:- start:19011 stop:20144 length:1134 start_codon:yes stop_codon:yes gene_type:complete
MILGLFGVPDVLIKNVAIGFNAKNWDYIGNNIFTATRLCGVLSLCLSIFFISLSYFISNNIFFEPRLYLPLIIFFIALTPQVLSRLYSACFIGFGKIWQSNLVDQTLSIWITLILFCMLLIFNITISIYNVAIIYALGRISVTIFTWIYWKKIFSYKSKFIMLTKDITKSSIPLLLVVGTNFLSASIATIMLGIMSNVTEVGLFSVCSRLAILMIFFLQVSDSAISPKLAALYKSNKIKEMQKMVQSVTGLLILVGTIIFLFFILFGEYILYLWGGDFANSYLILIILVFGQFINISTGACSKLLIMCGFEKLQSKISIFTLVLNFILNFIFIYLYEAKGAAIAVTLTLIVQNSLMLLFAYSKVGVMTIPFLKGKIK